MLTFMATPPLLVIFTVIHEGKESGRSLTDSLAIRFPENVLVIYRVTGCIFLLLLSRTPLSRRHETLKQDHSLVYLSLSLIHKALVREIATWYNYFTTSWRLNDHTLLPLAPVS